MASRVTAGAPILDGLDAAPVYERSFFDLQLRFAASAARVCGIGMREALLHFSNLYARFGLGRHFDEHHPGWRSFLEGWNRSPDKVEWTFQFYADRLPDRGPPAIVGAVGCFSYARLDATRVRLHLRAVGGNGMSTLGRSQAGERRAELRALIERVGEVEGASTRVVGVSWLYGIEAYRRLFPEPYLATARPTAPPFRSMALWGQLVKRGGIVRDDLADAVVRAAERARNVRELAQCFPLPVLTLDAPVTAFVGQV